MMKKQHGPAFRKQVIPLAACPTCKGRAVISGVFHEIDCVQCHASGWVRFDNGQALELQELVTQLGFNLRIACKQIEQRMTVPSFDVPDYYSQNNRRGAGGSNFTGD
jgi:hypothetical protein